MVDIFQHLNLLQLALCLKLQCRLNTATPRNIPLHADRNMGAKLEVQVKLNQQMIGWHHTTHMYHMEIFASMKIQIRLRHQCLHWHVHNLEDRKLSAVGEPSPWLGQKQDAALYRQQSLKPSWHMENIMVVSHSSCSTSSENYPISLTHYGHHFNSLQTAEHSAPILLPSAINH